jgi:hypothetical protein
MTDASSPVGAALVAAVEEVRELVAADGGDMLLTSVDGGTANLQLVVEKCEAGAGEQDAPALFHRLDKLAGYCGADPYELFDGIEDSREYQNEVDELFKSVRQIELVVGSALGKLSGIGSGAKNLPPHFSQRVAAAKKQHELIGKQCCSVGIKNASFGCPADPSTP